MNYEAMDLDRTQEPEGVLRPYSRVLLVEDNAGDAELVKTILTRNDKTLDVVHVGRLADAVQLLREDNFALAVLDLELPDSRGMETIEAVYRGAPRTPILVLTSNSDLKTETNAIRHGAQDCMMKGIMCSTSLARAVNHAVVRRQILDSVAADSLIDDLTGLHNRRGLHLLAPAMFRTANRLNLHITVFSVDMDGLKCINDTLGHAAGDAAIKETANVLRECFRESDILARLGGDEFIVIAVGMASEHGPTIMNRLTSRVAIRNSKRDQNYQLALSVGYVPCDPLSAASLESLINMADQRMYEIKRTNKGDIGMSAAELARMLTA